MKKKKETIPHGSTCYTVYYDNGKRIWYVGGRSVYTGINQPLEYTRDTKEKADALQQILTKVCRDATEVK